MNVQNIKGHSVNVQNIKGLLSQCPEYKGCAMSM